MATPTHITRRALIKAAPAVCLAAAVPSSAAAASETPVSVLYREWLACRAQLPRLDAECEAAMDRYIEIKPPVPDELVWKTGAEARVLPPRAAHDTGRDAAGNNVAYLTSFYWDRRIEALVKNDLHCDFDRKKLAIVKRYEAKLDAAREQSGLNAAEDAHEAHLEVVWATEHDLAAAAPESLADVRLKAIAVKTWLDDANTEQIVGDLLNSLVQLPA